MVHFPSPGIKSILGPFKAVFESPRYRPEDLKPKKPRCRTQKPTSPLNFKIPLDRYDVKSKAHGSLPIPKSHMTAEMSIQKPTELHRLFINFKIPRDCYNVKSKAHGTAPEKVTDSWAFRCFDMLKILSMPANLSLARRRRKKILVDCKHVFVI